MAKLYSKLFVLAVLAAAWLEPALALAQGDSGEGPGYTVPTVVTLIAAEIGRRVYKLKKQWDEFVASGQVKVTARPFADLQAELDQANKKIEALEATAEIQAELEETRRAKESAEARARKAVADLVATRDELKGLKRLINFDRQLNGEDVEDDDDGETEPVG
jgi:multidrug efflux pump subunit AcrA (membrane-fusion protein)